jgi:hypothetical protein
MDFKEIARQAEEMVAAGGQQADTDAVQKLAKTLNISPELAKYLMALEVRIRKLEGSRGPASAGGQDATRRRGPTKPLSTGPGWSTKGPEPRQGTPARPCAALLSPAVVLLAIHLRFTLSQSGPRSRSAP